MLLHSKCHSAKGQTHTCCVGMLGIWAFIQHTWASPLTEVLFYSTSKLVHDAIEICTGTLFNLYLECMATIMLPAPTHGYRKPCRPTKFTLHPQDVQYSTHSQYYMMMNLWTHSQCTIFRNIPISSPPNPHLLVVLLLWLLRMLVNLMKKVQDWSNLTDNMLWVTSL